MPVLTISNIIFLVIGPTPFICFKLLIFEDVNSDLQIRVYNNGTSNDSLEELSCDNPLSIDDIFRNLIVYDLNNNPALNIT